MDSAANVLIYVYHGDFWDRLFNHGHYHRSLQLIGGHFHLYFFHLQETPLETVTLNEAIH